MAYNNFPVYAYLPLDHTQMETRTIQFQSFFPYGSSSILSFSITTVSLNESPPYIAISYPCGDVTQLTPILVNGSLLYIYKNLDLALRELLPHITQNPLWTDSICINQPDTIEKSYQVAQLGSVYRLARMVIVWPGPGVSKLTSVYNTLSTLANMWQEWIRDGASLIAQVAMATSVEETDRRQFELLGMFCSATCKQYSDDDFIQLQRFFSMPWWERVWILQEYSLAKEVLFKCGNKLLDFRKLDSAATAIIRITDLEANSELKLEKARTALFRLCRGRMRAVAVRGFYTRTPLTLSLMRLLSFCATDQEMEKIFTTSGTHNQNFFRAHDPRDRVFALLSIAHDAKNLGFKPDYTMSHKEVYVEVAKAIISAGNLDILSLRNSETAERNLPSWAPDWSLPIEEAFSFDDTVEKDHQPYRTTRKMSPKGVKFEDHILTIKAIHVDTVVEISESFGLLVENDGGTNLGGTRIPDYVKGLVAMHDEFVGSPDRSDKTLEKLALCLIAGRYYDPHGSSFSDGDIPTCIWALRHLAWDEAEIPGIDLKFAMLIYPTTFLKTMSRRRLFITNNGHIGVASSSVKIGDEIFLLPGADVPFVLRLDESYDDLGIFQIRSEAYIHGLMKGQFLDTLPTLTTIKIT